MRKYRVIGLMSGTSLDGVDLAFCEFTFATGKWKFTIPVAVTYSYPEEWKQKLALAHGLTAEGLARLNVDYGKFLGKLLNQFIKQHHLSPDLIASHGHTVFHRPETGFTLQIGSGPEIAAQTGITTVCDFRSQDVALGGQGAPLVPLGDKLLFGEYDFCLNLGGFSNISFDENGLRKAYDICPVNIILNRLAQSLGHEFDTDGKLAASGTIHLGLLEALNNLDFYVQPAPKSLGREWVEMVFVPVLDPFELAVHDQLRTVSEHIAVQISRQTQRKPDGKLFVTGGGAKNVFLMNRIKALTGHQIIVPNEKIIDFKEALIFAFLGLLRYKSKFNCLASVTGAARDHSSGAIYSG
ncbi:MAG: anhydro-N-acetylmuramic acid kinase [Bacteroidales bacterium]|nr:anhydro-N-acetylmuramic acid kinase [Bacteroidales bacterium]